MKKFLKQEKGLATSDGMIAIIIIALFTGIIATLLYNIYISNTSLKRMSLANMFIVDVFEHAQKLDYEDVKDDNSQTSLITYFNNKYYDEDKIAHASTTDGQTDAKYKVIINVQKYNELEGNSGKEDLIKEITMTVKYKVGSRNQEITMTTVKTKER